jgi:hypothetical protein
MLVHEAGKRWETLHCGTTTTNDCILNVLYILLARLISFAARSKQTTELLKETVKAAKETEDVGESITNELRKNHEKILSSTAKVSRDMLTRSTVYVMCV